MNRSSALRQRGLMELRTVRQQGVERSAFLIPFCPHQLAAGLMIYLFLDGASFEILMRPWLHPAAFRDPLTLLLIDGFALTVSLLGTGMFLRWIFLRPPGLAFLPEGLLWSNGTVEWFIAWDWIERVARVRRRVVGTYCSLGLRLTADHDLSMTPLQLRWLKYAHRATGWHCLWPPGWCYTLPLPLLVYLTRAYHQKPGERPKIGSEAGLANVRAALAVIASYETTAQSPARAPT
jgi:hypothetical protein